MIAVASDWLACRLACRLACLLARSLAYKFAAARQEHLTYGVYTHKESHRVKHHQNSGANYGQAVLGSCKLPHDRQWALRWTPVAGLWRGGGWQVAYRPCSAGTG